MANLGHGQSGSKQHAQLRGDPPRVRPLWVYDEEDWKLMRSLPTGSLVCPVPGCSSQFQLPQENARGTRFLKDRPRRAFLLSQARQTGPGWRADVGPASLAAGSNLADLRIAGLPAITEHHATNSDIYVPGPSLAIEVQRWSTAFEKRTAARMDRDAAVLWVMTEDSKGSETDRALFHIPRCGGLLRVHDWSGFNCRVAP